MTKAMTVVGLLGLLLLAACAKTPGDGKESTAAAAPDGSAEAAEQSAVAKRDSAQPPDPSSQAASLAAFIDQRPECDQFRKPLEDASKDPTGAAATQINMSDIMVAAKQAGCFRKAD